MSRASQSATSSGGVPVAQQRRFEVMLRRPENRVCFDCDSRQPRWASTNLGVFFCLRCAGIHRSMGVHISKVKSTNMDVWEPFMIDFIEHVGNARGRMLYEHNMPDGARVKSYTDSQTAERLLRSKYERKQFYHPQFDSVLKQFLDTPIADDGSPSPSAVSRAIAHGSASGAQTSAAAAEAPAPVMEDIWGAPVASAVAVPSSAPAVGVQAPVATGARTSVSELFAHDTPVGAYPSGPQPTWHTAGHTPPPQPSHMMHMVSSQGQLYPQPHADMGYSSAPRAHTQPPPQAPSPGGNTGASNFSFLFQGHNGGGVSSTSAPNHSNAGDLLQGGRTAGGPRAAQSEILSLFDSVPPVGSGRDMSHGTAGGYGNRAWEPQVVRPYYKPEW